MKTLILNNKKFLLTLCLLVGSFLFSQKAFAQNALTLSVAPVIYDIAVDPDQNFKSGLRVINKNQKELTVFLQAVNFIPSDNKGSVKFLPNIDEDGNKNTLANWIGISEEPVIIPAEQSVNVPFSLNIPKNAPPGGHYAAIMVSTRPFSDTKSEANLQVSQIITSLLFVKVSGVVNELGIIRNFRTIDHLFEKPEVSFELDFENKGNVYLQPQGEIKIFNMWGEERGVIPVNQKVPHKQKISDFEFDGIRKLSFSWLGEGSLFDIGRYKAIATLAYGTEESHTISAKTNFWILPIKFIFISIFGFILVILIISWLIKLYIKRVLEKAGLGVNYQPNDFNRKVNDTDLDLSGKIENLSLKQTISIEEKPKFDSAKIIDFYLKNKKAISFGFIALILLFCLVIFMKELKVKNRSFEIISNDIGQGTRLSSEDIIYNQLLSENNLNFETDKTLPILEIVNRSSIPGEGAKLKIKLEEKGFQVSKLSADFSTTDKKTVIIYDSKYQKIAEDLSADLDSALLSTDINNSLGGVGIRIIIGGNFTNFSL